jgi:hypothetical protein
MIDIAMNDSISRRKFIGTTALALSSAVVGANVQADNPRSTETSEMDWRKEKR